MRLPVLVGMGGVNAAGRTSDFQSFRRIVLDALPPSEQQRTLIALAVMMGLISCTDDGHYRDRTGEAPETLLTGADVVTRYTEQVMSGTLVRRIEASYFDVDALHWQSRAVLNSDSSESTEDMSFIMPANQLPAILPENWTTEPIDEKQVRIIVAGGLEVKLNNVRDFPVKAAGQLPTGFDISKLYNARFQPRGLQMALFGATDALRSMGIEWSTVLENIQPDQVGVYSSSGFGQMDAEGYGGMHQARMKGDRVTTKALAMGINSMPTDFINAYVLANVGIASSAVAACATFLSNLRHAVADMQAGKIRVAMVGNSEAPILPELMDGFGTMGALATDDNMQKMYGDETVDHRRASRPFGVNCGFTIGEASQYFILMDDELALSLGAPCLGSVTDVFIDADGVKKSITAPGPGNYITMAKAAAAAKAVAGEDALKNNSFVLAHGSSTPQNRISESQIFDQVAASFDINDWPVVAIQAYLGHTIAPASGEQLATALGCFQYGILPGIQTIDAVADDVYQERLAISIEHQHRDADALDIAILNSKGFGGNNASAVVLSPKRTEAMMQKRYGEIAMAQYREKRQLTLEKSRAYFEGADSGNYAPIYRFGEGMIEDADITIDAEKIVIQGLANAIDLPQVSQYQDMCD